MKKFLTLLLAVFALISCEELYDFYNSYPPEVPELPFEPLEPNRTKREVVSVCESSAIIGWTTSNWESYDTDFAKAYKLSLYSADKLVVSWNIPANSTIWNEYAFAGCRFVFTGLEPDTEYSVEITNVTESYRFEPVKFKTTPSKLVVKPQSVTEGSVILYEDFSLLRMTGDIAAGAAGYSSENRNLADSTWMATGEDPTVNDPEPGWYLVDPSTETGLFNTLKNVVATSRYKDWALLAEDNTKSTICARPGYLKLGATAKCAWICTPELNCLQNIVDLELSFDAARYREDPRTGIVEVLTDVQVDDIKVVTSATRRQVGRFEIGENAGEWQRYTMIIPNVAPGSRIAIGADRAGIDGQHRFLVDNIELSIRTIYNKLTNQIVYTSTDDKIVEPKAEAFNAKIVSNIYKDGQGVITFSDDLTLIGNEAFRDCTTLATISIPDSVTEIGDNAFTASMLKYIVIPDSVTSIGYGIFQSCTNLQRVGWPKGVNYIPKLAFNCCKSLEFEIPDHIETIGSQAFSTCEKLTQVDIPQSVTLLDGYNPFSYCSNISKFSGNFASADGRCLVQEGKLISFAPANVKEYVVADDVTSIGVIAFAELTELEKVIIPQSVTTVNFDAFKGTSSLSLVCCKAATPPTAVAHELTGWNAFDSNAADRKIYVPAASLQAYKTADGWSAYADAICSDEVDLSQYTDLSAEGTANCYLVQAAGKYKFKAVKGNSTESVGTAQSAKVLWETFGTDVIPSVGELVADAGYKDDYIYFSTPATFNNGNASIAVYDANGTILWSWHIWCSTEGWSDHVYANNAGTMMDRNLGATSATPGSVGALGLLYQWGRKDPFLGSSDISTSTEALSTGTWKTVSGSQTVDYAIENPMTFIGGVEWCAGTGADDTDYTKRWLESEKTMYDPCPVGYRVPKGGVSGFWATAQILTSWDSMNNGCNWTLADGTTEWYPAVGYRSYDGGALYVVGERGYCWSASTYLSNTNHAYSLYFHYDGNVYTASNDNRGFGYSVRCVRDIEVVPEIPATHKILYTSTDGNVVTPYATNVFGANIVSNTYENGQGTITFDSAVTQIGANAFRECETLLSIELPESITAIGEKAFGWCGALDSIVIPQSVTSIGSGAFACCYNITKFEGKFATADGLAIICGDTLVAYAVNSAATAYAIPEGVVKVGYSAFNNNRRLVSITIPNSVQSIEEYAFCNSMALTSISIPNGVTAIEDYTLFGCNYLKEISLGSGVKSIGYAAFGYCIGLDVVTIPENVEAIGALAFEYCESLSRVYCKRATPPTLGGAAFDKNAADRKIYVPAASVNAYKTANGWNAYADAIVSSTAEDSEFSLAGSFSEWEDIPMEKVGDNLFVAKNINMEDYAAFKIKSVDSWDINYGAGDVAYLIPNHYIVATQGGENMFITEAGIYDVYFDSTNIFVYVVTAGVEYTTALLQSENGMLLDAVIYLKPNANWLGDNARFAAYFFNTAGNTWVSATDSDGDKIYEVNIPTGYTFGDNVVFCRMNPDTTANIWDNKWNQTGDLVIPTNGNNLYTVKDDTWDKGGGTWSTF